MNGTEENVTEQVQCFVKKRPDYLTWNEYFMAVALLSAQRSKDPNSQVHGVYYVVACETPRAILQLDKRLAAV